MQVLADRQLPDRASPGSRISREVRYGLARVMRWRGRRTVTAVLPGRHQSQEHRMAGGGRRLDRQHLLVGAGLPLSSSRRQVT
jgi:hypothetical protein